MVIVILSTARVIHSHRNCIHGCSRRVRSAIAPGQRDSLSDLHSIVGGIRLQEYRITPSLTFHHEPAGNTIHSESTPVCRYQRIDGSAP